jgi:hypothetical protein
MPLATPCCSNAHAPSAESQVSDAGTSREALADTPAKHRISRSGQIKTLLEDANAAWDVGGAGGLSSALIDPPEVFTHQVT